MCDFKVCRICLKDESKFYRFDDYNLKSFYEDLTNLRITAKDSLPQYFCYECAALLYKYNKFKERCLDGQNVVLNMLHSGPITYAGISELNTRKVHKCQYGLLDILTVNDRVKMCSTKHSQLVKIENITELKDESVIDFDYSDGAFTDDDDLEFKDPETDPVAEEQEVDLLDIKYEEDIIIDDNKELLPNLVISAPEVETKPDSDTADLKDEELSELKNVANIDVKVAKKPMKQRKGTKQTKKKKTKRKSLIKDLNVDSDTCEDINYSDSNTGNESTSYSDTNYDDCRVTESATTERKRKVKSKRKAAKIPPETAKGYKFSKPKKGLAFLDSGYWKKSSLTEEEALKNFEAKAKDRKYLNAAFKCTDCYRGFSQLSMLERHIPQRHGEAVGKLVCRFCKMRFKSKYFLNKHMRQHYTKYECLRCDLVCTLENSALFHEEYHNGVVRKCPHCDREFKHLSTFYTHLRTHRSVHTCALCGESFVSDLGLRLHRKAKHLTDTEPPLKFLEEHMFCEICQMKFETKDAYEKHLSHSAMHTDQNKVDDVVLSNLLKQDEECNAEDGKDINKTEELHKRRSRVEITLSAVRKSHSKDFQGRAFKKPTTCHHCGKHFDTQSACMKHHLAMHPRTSFFSPKERVICEVCGTSLAPGSVASHLNQHTRSKMYTCDTCGRSFTTSTMLRTHMVTHTGEKRFACTLCDKRFTQNGSLSLHYRTFHLKQPYPKRNRRKKIDKPTVEVFTGKEE